MVLWYHCFKHMLRLPYRGTTATLLWVAPQLVMQKQWLGLSPGSEGGCPAGRPALPAACQSASA